MNNKDTEAPERLTKQVCPDGFIDCRAHPASSLRNVEYARVDPPPAPTGEKGARKLTLPELNHISGLLEAERESGEYAGPREQYYARTERLIKWREDQIGEK